MKKTILLVLLFVAITNLSAEISVKSFRKLESDMTARIDAKKIDQNGDVCAIIKVVTTQDGFTWEPDGLGIKEVVRNGAEYWLYVPFGAKRLTINHSKLGILRDYMYPLPIEKACVYEMMLTTGKVVTTVEEEITSQWLVLSPEPADAMVYINDEFVKTGEYQAKLKPDIYTYRVEALLHHSDAGKIDITDAKKNVSVKLKPAYGYISVSSTPEPDAKVVIDGKLQAKVTPFTTDAIASGEHTVQIIKEMYQPTAQKVTVTDEHTTVLKLALQPNFAEVNVTTTSNAKIYINSQQKGIGIWNGRLSAGVYTLESQLDKHRTAKQDIEVKAGDTRTINLTPTPIYGALDIVTSPSGASILIDGKDYGTTPNTIPKLLIGEYTVLLSKAGYANVNKNITVAEGKSGEINETLINGRAVTINSTPSGINLFIDGFAVGKTPYNGNLTFGNHVLRIENEEKKGEKTVSVVQIGGESYFGLNFGPQNFTETVNGVSFDMVTVKGGSFMMGCDNGESNEKPAHKVTLGDYAIGKTEVTQGLWQAVMGNNPSNWKGDNLPVEQVSWNDIRGFLNKLNQLTGKTFRLPTEAEWEYAALGGVSTSSTTTSSRLNTYAGSNKIADVAWYNDNSNAKTHPVANKQPNELGLYDMTGNVWEWCTDWYGDYSGRPQTNPSGALSGSNRVIRGGSWNYNAQGCRSASRYFYYPNFNTYYIGFRLVSVR